jgi:hypothetical protein
MDGQQQVRFTKLGLEVIERACTSMPELRVALRDHVLQGCGNEGRKAPQDLWVMCAPRLVRAAL